VREGFLPGIDANGQFSANGSAPEFIHKELYFTLRHVLIGERIEIGLLKPVLF
jgi:hypothetical protein